MTLSEQVERLEEEVRLLRRLVELEEEKAKLKERLVVAKPGPGNPFGFPVPPVPATTRREYAKPPGSFKIADLTIGGVSIGVEDISGATFHVHDNWKRKEVLP